MQFLLPAMIISKSLYIKYNQIGCFSTHSTAYKDKYSSDDYTDINKRYMKSDPQFRDSDKQIVENGDVAFQSFNCTHPKSVPDMKYWEIDRQLRNSCGLADENRFVASQLHDLDDHDSSSKLKYWETDRQSRISQGLMGENRGDNASWSIGLTHTDSSGKAVMVDVGEKDVTMRMAEATGVIVLGKDAFKLLKENKLKKGDVLVVSQIAGITGAKKTSDLIPLCHNIPLSKLDVSFELNEADFSVVIKSFAKSMGKTGVEMEALTAVSIAALTIYDMCKAVTKDIIIKDIKLLSKSGGKSGDFKRNFS